MSNKLVSMAALGLLGKPWRLVFFSNLTIHHHPISPQTM